MNKTGIVLNEMYLLPSQPVGVIPADILKLSVAYVHRGTGESQELKKLEPFKMSASVCFSRRQLQIYVNTDKCSWAK